MLLKLAEDLGDEAREQLLRDLANRGLALRPSPDRRRVAVAAPAGANKPDAEELGALAQVDEAEPLASGFKLIARALLGSTEVVQVGSHTIGGHELALVAGPCAVEGDAQLDACAALAQAAGARFLRGGAFKPRTSPYAFQGMEEEGLRLLRQAGDRHGLAVVTEVMSTEAVPLVGHYADMLQVGARNMQNFSLLKALGGQPHPVLLKRGMAATIEEWLLAAEYIVAHGNPKVVLCERGIRSFDPAMRNVLDLAAVPLVQSLTYLPVIVDPSHALGRRDAVPAMAAAALAAGADGVMLEVHPVPHDALCDGAQALTFPDFVRLAERLRRLAPVMGRSLASEVQG